MAYEGLTYEDGIVTFSPGIVDVHGHPRAGDTFTDVSFNALDSREGKAGIAVYTETALASGITVVHAMPNESIRRYIPEIEDTKTIPYPISNWDRAMFMERAISTESRIQKSYYLGLDPNEIIKDDGKRLDAATLDRNFKEAGGRTKGLKIYGDITNGGQNIPIDHIPNVAEIWYRNHPEKPVIMHLEDGNVQAVLEEISQRENGHDIPIHIAHVSSQEELEAVIWAKEQGMNVTCEVTPHHLFATEEARELVGNYGCMKPSLKTAQDVQFLWDNLQYIDIIASDCAPHKVSDKEGEATVWGVANHTVMMPLLLGAVEEGRLSLEDVYEKMVVNPRKRFNLEVDDKTISAFNLNTDIVTIAGIEAEINPRYGQSMFKKLEEVGQRFHLTGIVEYARSGSSRVERERETGRLLLHYATDVSHLVA